MSNNSMSIGIILNSYSVIFRKRGLAQKRLRRGLVINAAVVDLYD